MVPETKGVPLEEIAALFGEGDEVTVFAANIHVDHTNHELVVDEVGEREQSGKRHTELYPTKADDEASQHVESL